MSTSATIKAGAIAGGERSLPALGSIIAGRYRIERVLGAGGMGFVYAARNLNLNELVAVKVLHPKVAVDEESTERFLREARACVKIKNEHVVKVLDVFTGDMMTPPYILMEFLEGAELGKVLSEHGPMPIQMAVDYLLQACEAIAEAHAYGIIHRDIKPANLLLTHTSDGAPFVKVLDFGISKALAPDDGSNQNLTETTAVFGSPTYMSPEQVRSAKHVDARADVWSLGVVLFELLTGRVPFRGESMSGLLASIVADAPMSLTSLRPDAPPGLDRVVAGCLEKNRDMRIPSVADLAQLLAPYATAAGQKSIEVIGRLAAATTTGGSLRPASMRPGAFGSSSSPVAFGATEPSIVTFIPIRKNRTVPLVIAGAALVGAVAVAAVIGVKLRQQSAARDARANASAGAASIASSSFPTVSTNVVAPQSSVTPASTDATTASSLPSAAPISGVSVHVSGGAGGNHPGVRKPGNGGVAPPTSAPGAITSAPPTAAPARSVDPLDYRGN